MIKVIRTDSSDSGFISLVKQLDAELQPAYSRDFEYYSQFNKIENLDHVVVVYDNSYPVACGAMKEYDVDSMEVKRMFTEPKYRAKGNASRILQELENWARELAYSNCVLETGTKQLAAIELYLSRNYQVIPNYGQYKEMPHSICFKKFL